VNCCVIVYRRNCCVIVSLDFSQIWKYFNFNLTWLILADKRTLVLIWNFPRLSATSSPSASEPKFLC
jgi:hypothetical protein